MKRKTIVSLIAVAAVVAVAMLAGCVEEKKAPTSIPQQKYVAGDVDEIEVWIWGDRLMYLEFLMSDGRTAGRPGSDFSNLKLSDGDTKVKIETYYNSKQLATKTIYVGSSEIFPDIDIPKEPEDGPRPDLINVEIQLPNGKKVSEDIEIKATRIKAYNSYSWAYFRGEFDADRGYSPKPNIYDSDMGSYEKDLIVDGYYDGYYGFTERYEMPETTKTIKIA